jgi:hypothetical protein
MSDLREGCCTEPSRHDQIIEYVLRIFPDAKILTEEEVKALPIPPPEKQKEITEVKKLACGGARRAIPSAARLKQRQETYELFDLSCFKELR